jgi:hypothetical protein
MDLEAVRQRINELKDRDMVVRQRAVDALIAMSADAPDVVAALRAALRDASSGVRRRAAQALGKLGPAGSPAEAELTEALRDRVHTVRDAAREALAAIKSPRPK